MQHFLVYTINGWGAGKTEAEAVANYRKSTNRTASKYVLEVFEIADDTPEDRKPRVGDEGGVEYWPGQKRLEAWRVNGKTRTKLGGA